MDNGVESRDPSYIACLGHVGISILRRRSVPGFFLASLASKSNGHWLGFVRATLTAAEEDAVALDGKTVRGAASSGQVAPHLLAFCTHRSQETLLQVRVSEKTNEIPVAQALLLCLALRGRVYTADALHTQVAFTQAVVDLQGYYLLTAKENQPTIYTDLQTYFSDPEASFEQEQTINRHKGRLEVRQIRVTTLMKGSPFAVARAGTSGSTEAQRHGRS